MNVQSTGQFVAELYNRALEVLKDIQDSAIERRNGPLSVPRFTIAQASGMVGRAVSTIKDAERDGRLPGVEKTPNGRRIGYTLGEINQMRDLFGTRPSRAPTDPVAVIACQNFKGGVGKTTGATHLGQSLAKKGYRGLLVDCDSQASMTQLFGYLPDLDIDVEQTIYPFLRDVEIPDLRYAVRPTHWDGLSLIPANLRLYSAEYEMAAKMAHGDPNLLDRLAEGIQSVAEDFDFVILDPPPALGTISLSVMRAANALLIPVPPTVMDFSSTAAFFAMLHETINLLEQFGMPINLSWIKVLLSRVDEGKSMQKEISALLRKMYGETVLRAAMRNSAEIDNATARLMSVYELDRPTTSREVYNRAVRHLDAVSNEIELEIRKTWPSHANTLIDEAVI